MISMNNPNKFQAMSDLIFRYVSGEKGIYEVVDLFCPKSDRRRNQKPDGSWLSKAGPKFPGPKFPGAISFWTPEGLEKYILSGLQQWHLSVIDQSVQVIVAQLKREPLYRDELQVITHAIDFEVIETLSASAFLEKYIGEI